MSAAPVLEVADLHTHFVTREGVARPVDGVGFQVGAGQVMGLVGESGSGKTMTGFSLIGLIDPPGRMVSGRIVLEGRDLFGQDERAWRRIRGSRLAMIFQDPMMTLNPVLRIDTQMIEAVRAHERVSRRAARARAVDALERVGMPAARERLSAYPHQFSGGMRQRVAIAIALLNRPAVIICDEPTTALDVTIQGQILYEMQKLCSESGTALIWISHDLSVVAGLADTVAVMYAGRIVESGTTAAVLEEPRHPYTRGLIASTPAAAVRAGRRHGAPLAQIPGTTPALVNLPSGCPFRTRCERADAACLAEPPLSGAPAGHQWRCFHPHLEPGLP